MNLTNFNLNYQKDLKIKSKNYNKLALLNYFLFAIFFLINVIPYLLLLIENDFIKALTLIFLIIIHYFINTLLSIIMLTHSILQNKVTINSHTIISYIITSIAIIVTFVLILF